MHRPHVSIHISNFAQSFVADFARIPPLCVRLDAHFSQLIPGRVVALVVRVQVFDAVVVTVTYLTHDFSVNFILKNTAIKVNFVQFRKLLDDGKILHILLTNFRPKRVASNFHFHSYIVIANDKIAKSKCMYYFLNF